MVERNKSDDAELILEQFFADARKAAPRPSDALMNRVLADATEVVSAGRRQASAAADRQRPRVNKGRGVWEAMFGNFMASIEKRLVAGVLAASMCIGFLAGFTNVQMSSEVIMAMIVDDQIDMSDFVAVTLLDDIFPEELS